jgi:hypothetical protein
MVCNGQNLMNQRIAQPASPNLTMTQLINWLAQPAAFGAMSHNTNEPT